MLSESVTVNYTDCHMSVTYVTETVCGVVGVSVYVKEWSKDSCYDVSAYVYVYGADCDDACGRIRFGGLCL